RMAEALSARRAFLVTVAAGGAALLLAQSYDLSVAAVTVPTSGSVGVPLAVSVGVSPPGGAAGGPVTTALQPAVTRNAPGAAPGCSANAATGDAATTVMCPATGLTNVAISVSPKTAGTLNVVAGVIGNEADPLMVNNSGRRTISIASATTPSP